MNSNSPTRSPSLAHHEAGHALAVALMNGRVTLATIEPRERFAGYVDHVGIDRIQDFAVVVAAGPIAEAAFSGDCYSPSDAVRHANRLETIRSDRWASDLQHLREALGESRPGAFDSTPRLWQSAKHQAAELVLGHRAEWKAIAAALLARGRLTGDDVHRLVFGVAPPIATTAKAPEPVAPKPKAPESIAPAEKTAVNHAMGIILSTFGKEAPRTRKASFRLPRLWAARSGLGCFSAMQASHTPARAFWYLAAPGLAVVPITGILSKDGMYGTSTKLAAHAVIQAARSDGIDAVLLHIDSPGGEVAGTYELAEAVRSANHITPVYAFIDDLGASAAYWVASQARSISMNSLGEAGSIGIFATVYDSSKAAEKDGTIVHVIGSGLHKGDTVPGAPVRDGTLSYLQEQVNQVNAFFVQAVADGRRLSRQRLEAATDGRTFLGNRALEMGLVDHIEPMESTVARIMQQMGPRVSRGTPSRKS